VTKGRRARIKCRALAPADVGLKGKRVRRGKRPAQSGHFVERQGIAVSSLFKRSTRSRGGRLPENVEKKGTAVIGVNHRRSIRARHTSSPERLRKLREGKY